MQIFDGLLTYWGVTYYGHGSKIEGNPLVKCAIEYFGPILALLIIKGFAILALLALAFYIKEKLSKVIQIFISGIYTISFLLWMIVLIDFYLYK